jgi:lysophospholipase L1-like esterase
MGCSKEETNAMEKEWETSPTLLVLGDRQTTAGGRPGGWCQLLMDGLNSGREMMTYSTQATYRQEVTMAEMLHNFRSLSVVTARYIIIQSPRGDAIKQTPLADYRNQTKALVNAIGEAGSIAVMATIPIQDNDPNGTLSQKISSYNQILRTVSKEMDVALTDINAAMQEAHTSNPKLRTTFDGERFNREGSVLMAEGILRAIDLADRLTPQLRETWRSRDFYAEKDYPKYYQK